MNEPTKEEIQRFYEDDETRKHKYPGEHSALSGRAVLEDTKPLFGEDFRRHVIKRLERDVGPGKARETYNAIEQETVTYVANFIKDSIFAAFKKVKRH